jgi:hypothetical protein
MDLMSWFRICAIYTNFLAHLVYKIKNILIYFKPRIKIKIMDLINLCTNGFILIFKIYFHSIRGAPFENQCSRTINIIVSSALKVSL